MDIILHRDVDEFIDSLERPTRAKWARLIDLLALYGLSLGMPHARRLPEGFIELRVRGKQEIRAFALTSGNQIMILHAFIKKTQKIPLKEIMIAKQRRKGLT